MDNQSDRKEIEEIVQSLEASAHSEQNMDDSTGNSTNNEHAQEAIGNLVKSLEASEHSETSSDGSTGRISARNSLWSPGWQFALLILALVLAFGVSRYAKSKTAPPSEFSASESMSYSREASADNEMSAGSTPQTLLDGTTDSQESIYAESTKLGDLSKSIGDPNPEVRREAAVRLGSIPSAEAVIMATELLSDKDDSVVLCALQALGSKAMNPKIDIHEHVLPLLSSNNVMIQKQACLTVGHRKTIEAAPILIDMLESEDRGVRLNAYWALKNISGYSLPPTEERWREWLDSTQR